MFVLSNKKIPSEHADSIIPFLQQLKCDYGVPVACVHDMETGILKFTTPEGHEQILCQLLFVIIEIFGNVIIITCCFTDEFSDFTRFRYIFTMPEPGLPTWGWNVTYFDDFSAQTE
jgi:hypothetical protein